MPTKPGDPTSMGEKASGRIPPSPRLLMNGVEILPLVDDEWQPVKDRWVLPGCQVMSTQEIDDLATAEGFSYRILN